MIHKFQITNSKLQKGEIATTLALLTMVVITVGVLIGAGITTTSTLPQSETQAAVTGLNTISQSHANVYFDSRVGRSINSRQDVISGTMCFTSVTPPKNGRYWLELVAQEPVKDAQGNIVGYSDLGQLGKTLDMRISDSPNTYQCDFPGPKHPERHYSLVFWNKFVHVTPTIDESKVARIVVRLNVNNGVWNFAGGAQPPIEVATLDHVPFLGPQNQNPTPIATLTPGGGSTPNPAHSPTPIPTSAPADLSVVVKFKSDKLPEGLTKFKYTYKICDLESKNPNDLIVKNCGTGTNPKSSLQEILSTETDLKQKTNPSFTLPRISGEKVLEFNYLIEKSSTTQTQDSTGTLVEFPTGFCTQIKHKYNSSYCLFNLNGTNASKEIGITLPDLTKKSFTFFINNSRCLVTVDTDGKIKSYPDADCNNPTLQNGTVTIALHNKTANSIDSTWFLRRCHGDIRYHDGFCASIYSTNEIAEASAVPIPANSTRTCSFKLSDYPANYFATEGTDGFKQEVRSKVSCQTTGITPTPTTVSINSPTPPQSTPDSYYATFAFFNSSNKIIDTLKIKTCFGTEPCKETSVKADVGARQRGVVEHNLNVPVGATSYTLSCSFNYRGETQENQCPNEVKVDSPQNIVYKISTTTSQITGSGSTEIQASDANGDGCTNGKDFSDVINLYGEEFGLTTDSGADINGDGVVNSIDIEYTLSNLNKGAGCQFNQ